MKHEIVRWFSAMLATLAVGVSWGDDPLVIEPGSPKVMTESDCAVSYSEVTVLDDLTLDGANGNIMLQSVGNIQIGGQNSDKTLSANSPVMVVVTNGATWKNASSKTLTVTRYGGTLEVSSSSEPTYDISAEASKIGNLGPYLYLKNSQYIYNAGKCELRLLPNGVTSFRAFKNEASNVVMRLLFEGGVNFIQAVDSSSAALFQVAENGHTIIESVDGNPMLFKGLSWKSKFFSGAGTLETSGDGDFVFDVDRADSSGFKAFFELGKDANGTVVWGHKWRTCLFGRSVWTVASDDILPHGTLPSGEVRGPVVIGSGNASSVWATTLNLNGKTVAVNALLANETGKNVVTNSAATVATFGLDVTYGATNLSEVITATFAADSSSTIKMRKIGAGTLTVDAALPDFAGIEVADGMLRFGASATVAGSFVCDNGAVQVDSDVTLDLSSISDANISISNLTVAATAGTITKFRPAENGILNIVGVGGDLPGIYRAPISLPAVVGAERFATWGVAVDGVLVRGATVSYANGALTAHLTHGLVIVVR